MSRPRDFTYIRWRCDSKGTEGMTTTWKNKIVDRTADLQNWVTGAEGRASE